MFDVAFVDTLRALAGPGSRMVLLLPWSQDLAPLIGAAMLDLAPIFDPEAPPGEGPSPRGVVLYVPPGDEASAREGDPFWQASHLSLAEGGHLSLADAVRAHPPTHVVALGTPQRPAAFRQALRGRRLKVLVFRSLYAREQAVEALGVASDGALDLEETLPEPLPEPTVQRTLEASVERSQEVDLEPFVPFGVLLQSFFDDWLEDEEPMPVSEPS